VNGKYMVFIQPGENGTGTSIHIPALDYDKVWPDCDDCNDELTALITALSGSVPEMVLPSFHVLVGKLTPEMRAQIDDPSGHIAIPIGDRDIADVLDGVIGNLGEILDITEAEDEERHE